MKNARYGLVLLLGMLLGQVTLAQVSSPVRILPLGDSITHGFGGQVSYRRALWFQLQNAGYSVDFVGSHTDFVSPVPAGQDDFDLDHEGHSGFRADQIDANLNVWLQGYQADIVLLHLGTNDLNQGQNANSTLAEIASIISKLRAHNPTVTILLARIIPMRNFDTGSFNTALDAWVGGQSDPLSPLIVVDQYTGYDPVANNIDNFHPNATGDALIAQRWFDALQPLLSDGNLPPQVNAGSNAVLASTGESATLVGSVTDDGLPSGSQVTQLWSVVSGPGTVSFTQAQQVSTGASFSAEGLYELRLTASDSIFTTSDEVLVQVGDLQVPGLVGHWPLDEGSGITALDSSANGNHGTLRNTSGNPWIGSGQINGALAFDGVDDDVDMGTAAALRPSTFTVAAWIRPDASASDWGWIAGEGDNFGIAVNRFNFDDFLFYYYNGSGWVFDLVPAAGLHDGDWHHVAGVLDAANNTMRLFIDSEEVAVRPTSGAISYAKLSGFRVGSMNGQRHFDGDIDDVRLYNRALSEAEVAAIALGEGTPPTNAGPTVNAGADATVQQPDMTVQVSSTVSDDGLPSGTLTRTWSQISGPGSASFSEVSFMGTTLLTDITLNQVGTYVLRLTVSDGELSSTDDISITLEEDDPPPPVNTTPTVNAGADASVQLPANTVQVNSTVSDDGLPSGTLTRAWSQISGPGTASFSEVSFVGTALLTDITLNQVGTYVLRLTVSDGALSTTDDISVTLDADDPPPPTGDSPVVSGISGFWQLDEGSGTQAADSSGQGNTGTLMGLNNGDWSANGVYNSALCFNGSSGEEVAVPNPSAGITAASVTVAGWVQVNPSLNTWAWVAGHGDNYGLVANRFRRDDVLFYFYNGSRWRSVGFNNTGVTDGEWHHIAGSFDSATGIISVYLDGVLLNSAFFQETISYSIGNNASLGSMQGIRNFNGCLDELQIYGRALTEQEVQTLAEPPDPGEPTNTSPTVNAGTDATVQLPDMTVQVSSTVSDDGLPSGSLTRTWSQISGPGTASFSEVSFVGTTLLTDITVNQVGTYVLRLTVSDGALSSTDDISITLEDDDPPPPSGNSPVLSGISGFWRLDEGGGTQAADSSGQSNTGTLMGLGNSDWLANGVYNSALCFNGSSGEEVAIPNPGAGITTASVTVAGWVRVDPSLNTWAWVAGHGDNYGLVANRFNKDDLLFYFYNGSGWPNVGVNNTGITDGEWHHVAGSYNEAAGVISVYMDGVLLASEFVGQSISYGIGSAASIGSMQGARNFNGCLDEIQIYGRALSDAEVQTLASPATMEASFGLQLETGPSPIALNGIDADFVENISYGPDARNTFDIFMPTSGSPTALAIYVHGGSFVEGDKSYAYLFTRDEDIRQLLSNGVAFATINYRLLQQNDSDGVIKSLTDSARAVQFMRYHADSLNIDKTRVGMYGFSAGAGTSLWLAFHDDLAIPGHSDPVLRESTRLSAAGAIEGQATYDLVRWETTVFSSFGLALEQIATDLGLFDRLLAFNGVSSVSDIYVASGEAYRANLDMLALMSADDPGFHFSNTIELPSYPANESQLFHHPLQGQAVFDRANSVGLENIVYAPAVGLSDASGETLMQFLLRKLQ